MINEQAGAVFDVIDYGSRLVLGYRRAAKAAAHIPTAQPLVANVLGTMHHHGAGFGFIVKTLLLAIQL
jgi:hypothetical protein